MYISNRSLVVRYYITHYDSTLMILKHQFHSEKVFFSLFFKKKENALSPFK